MSSTSFRKKVWAYYRMHGRHDLPWRKTHDPYKILVSEVMLQQTQVERVKPYYEAFIRRFPTARKLSAAPLSAVLSLWQGLGYNRRAKLLREAAQAVGHGVFPKRLKELEKLPGVGPYTARAVMAFAYGKDAVLVETNVRTAVMHHFFPKRRKVSDEEIEKVLLAASPKGRGRQWNYALMDYGAHLKRSGVRLNAKSKHYVKQTRFSGSMREARGALLKELTRGSRAEVRLLGLLGDDRRTQLKEALAALTRERLVRRVQAGRYALA